LVQRDDVLAAGADSRAEREERRQRRARAAVGEGPQSPQHGGWLGAAVSTRSKRASAGVAWRAMGARTKSDSLTDDVLQSI
jgi:hypothetical protein